MHTHVFKTWVEDFQFGKETSVKNTMRSCEGHVGRACVERISLPSLKCLGLLYLNTAAFLKVYFLSKVVFR